MNCSAPRSSASRVARSARRRSNPSPRGCGAKGKNVAVIPIGASIPLGALGFVRAVEETKSRLEAIGHAHRLRLSFKLFRRNAGRDCRRLPAFRLAGSEGRRRQPDDPSASISAEVGKIIRGVGEALGAQLSEDVTVLDDYVGGGYGVPSGARRRSDRVAGADRGRDPRPGIHRQGDGRADRLGSQGKLTENDNVMFWHTGGQLALFYVPGEKEG